jgi:hypothetical protein
MEPGTQTDSLIARKVWRAIVVNDTETGESYMVGQEKHDKVPVPPFSTDYTEAHKVVEHFQNMGWTFRVQSVPEEDVFRACFFKDDNRTYKFIKADTMPLVICEAAIAAINGTNVKP